jgi:hypothetical protein
VELFGIADTPQWFVDSRPGASRDKETFRFIYPSLCDPSPTPCLLDHLARRLCDVGSQDRCELAFHPFGHCLLTEQSVTAGELLAKVKRLAHAGHPQAELTKALGLKSVITLHSRLLRATQLTGKPIPNYRAKRSSDGAKRIEIIEVRRRGKANAFGVNIPQDPLERAGFAAGDKLRVTVRGKAVFLRQ